MTMRPQAPLDDLADLADLAEVEVPPIESCGAAFLANVAADVADRMDALGKRFHADEIPSVGLSPEEMPDASMWHAWLDLGLWEEDVTHLVQPNADMTWRAETALEAAAMRLAAGLVARHFAERMETTGWAS